MGKTIHHPDKSQNRIAKSQKSKFSAQGGSASGGKSQKCKLKFKSKTKNF